MELGIDVSKLFPDYDRADVASYDPSTERAIVRLHQGQTYSALAMNVGALYQALGDIRAATTEPTGVDKRRPHAG